MKKQFFLMLFIFCMSCGHEAFDETFYASVEIIHNDSVTGSRNAVTINMLSSFLEEQNFFRCSYSPSNSRGQLWQFFN